MDDKTPYYLLPDKDRLCHDCQGRGRYWKLIDTDTSEPKRVETKCVNPCHQSTDMTKTG